MKRATILCVEATTVLGQLPTNGFVPSTQLKPESFLRSECAWFAPRDVVETREEFKQLIPYVVLMHKNQVALYCRTPEGGEARLHGKYSIGFGGHIDISDAVLDGETIDVDATVRKAAQRELDEEVMHAPVDSRSLLGLLYDDRDAVSRVHLGLVELWHVTAPTLAPAESAISECMFLPLEHLSAYKNRMEGWSCLVADFLSKDYALSHLSVNAEEG